MKELISKIENFFNSYEYADILDGVAIAEEEGFSIISHDDEGKTGWEMGEWFPEPINYQSEEEYTLVNKEGKKIIISCTTAGCGSVANRYFSVKAI
jgi:hypothetical protein